MEISSNMAVEDTSPQRAHAEVEASEAATLAARRRCVLKAFWAHLAGEFKSSQESADFRRGPCRDSRG